MDSEDDGSSCCCSCASSSSSLKSALLLFLDNTGVTGLSFNKFDFFFSSSDAFVGVVSSNGKPFFILSLFLLLSLSLSLS